MSLVAEMTLVHMEAGTALDRIDRGLTRLTYQSDERRERRRELDQMIALSLRLRDRLERFFEREQEELFPLARRVLGEEISDLRGLAQARGQLLEGIDDLIVALGELSESPEGQVEQGLVELTSCVEELRRRYDAHCDVRRAFLQTHSTILFPGGLATE